MENIHDFDAAQFRAIAVFLATLLGFLAPSLVVRFGLLRRPMRRIPAMLFCLAYSPFVLILAGGSQLIYRDVFIFLCIVLTYFFLRVKVEVPDTSGE